MLALAPTNTSPPRKQGKMLFPRLRVGLVNDPG